MWRDPAVPKTRAKYRVPPGAPQTNRMRAVKAWYGDFFDKVVTFPEFKKYQDPSRLGDLSAILDVKESLKCKPFSWYMDRFPNIYHAGGLLPDEIVMLQWRENNNMRLDAHSNRCLSRPGGTLGNARQPFGNVALKRCDEDDFTQWWHRSNRREHECCTGMRGWDSDQCLQLYSSGMRTSVCNMDSVDKGQFFNFEIGSDDLIEGREQDFFIKHKSDCLTADNGVTGVQVQRCGNSDGRWYKINAKPPMERVIYEQQSNATL